MNKEQTAQGAGTGRLKKLNKRTKLIGICVIVLLIIIVVVIIFIGSFGSENTKPTANTINNKLGDEQHKSPVGPKPTHQTQSGPNSNTLGFTAKGENQTMSSGKQQPQNEVMATAAQVEVPTKKAEPEKDIKKPTSHSKPGPKPAPRTKPVPDPEPDSEEEKPRKGDPQPSSPIPSVHHSDEEEEEDEDDKELEELIIRRNQLARTGMTREKLKEASKECSEELDKYIDEQFFGKLKILMEKMSEMYGHFSNTADNWILYFRLLNAFNVSYWKVEVNRAFLALVGRREDIRKRFKPLVSYEFDSNGLTGECFDGGYLMDALGGATSSVSICQLQECYREAFDAARRDGGTKNLVIKSINKKKQELNQTKSQSMALKAAVGKKQKEEYKNELNYLGVVAKEEELKIFLEARQNDIDELDRKIQRLEAELKDLDEKAADPEKKDDGVKAMSGIKNFFKELHSDYQGVKGDVEESVKKFSHNFRESYEPYMNGYSVNFYESLGVKGFHGLEMQTAEHSEEVSGDSRTLLIDGCKFPKDCIPDEVLAFGNELIQLSKELVENFRKHQDDILTRFERSCVMHYVVVLLQNSLYEPTMIIEATRPDFIPGCKDYLDLVREISRIRREKKEKTP